jgi:heme exporter protein A
VELVVLEARWLTKREGYREIISGVSLTLEAGECLALLGPNGAGKTSLLRVLAGLTRPDAGELRMNGGDLDRRRIGFSSHQPYLYEGLTAEENLLFFGRLYGLREPRRRAGELLARLGLAPFRHDLVRSFSRGMQQRLDLTRAFLHRPAYLFLDEPHTAMDKDGCALFNDLLGEHLRRSGAAVVATHDLDLVPFWGRALILQRGRPVTELLNREMGEKDLRAFSAAGEEEK